MSNELIINASLPETRIALIEDGQIQELLIERASEKGIVGNIYKGRVTRVLPGMQAAFVDIGLEKAAFLYVDDVYVHSEIWEEEEGQAQEHPLADVHPEGEITPESVEAGEVSAQPSETEGPSSEGGEPTSQMREIEPDSNQEDDHDEEDDEDKKPVEMGPEPQSPGNKKGSDSDSDSEGEDPNDGDGDGDEDSDSEDVEGTISPDGESENAGAADSTGSKFSQANSGRQRRHRRGRRGGKFKRRPPANEPQVQVQSQQNYPDQYHEQMNDEGPASLSSSNGDQNRASSTTTVVDPEVGRPQEVQGEGEARRSQPVSGADRSESRPEFRAQRFRDRRIRQKSNYRAIKPQANIQDLLKEGQEVLVQVAKDPIATKGARLTCHISLPGRHLVCMPTIDHVGVSRRIERDDERRRLRDYVEKNRPKNLGFIVRTASGKQQSEKRIKQDIDYLTKLWTEIREKAGTVTAPALVYEDLNVVLRAVRDWVTEEIDKVIVDSRYHYNEMQRFVSHFMPVLKQKVELYHGDIPIFDAYGISTELSRALERKVWLKSGGYIVIDQAEALVAIDVNTGRYVGKKNLEDTILKTNLEAVQEVAYQLRLRNCGGIIIIDLIDMEKEENRYRVYRALEEALSRDRARPTIMKISELGLIEMTRKRTRDTIVRALCESCTHCEGKGFIKSKQTVAYEVMREIEREGIERDVGKILVQAHSDVIDILAIDERETLDQLEKRYRKMIYLQSVTDFHPEQFEVTADKRERPERGRTNERSADFSDRDRNRGRTDRDRGEKGDRGERADRTDRTADRERTERSDKGRGGQQESKSQGEAGMGSTERVILPVVPNPLPDSVGNVTPSQMGQANSTTNPVGAPASGSDEGMDEEDRLAFLRAQAAQDAALARLGSGSGHGSSSRTGESGPHRQDRNASRRNARGGRRGSNKFRRGSGGSGGGGSHDRNNRGVKANPGHYSSPQKWSEPAEEQSTYNKSDLNNSSSGGQNSGQGGGDGSSGGGTNGGKGEDFLQSPV